VVIVRCDIYAVFKEVLFLARSIVSGNILAVYFGYISANQIS